MASILVTDGEQRAALAAVRSLGRAGHQVYVCASRARTLAGASRFCQAQTAVPDALLQPNAFVDAVERIVQDREIEALLPISEPALLALLPERGRFRSTRIPFPEHERFLRICDKAAVMEAAAQIGIRVPKQQVLLAPGERKTLNLQSLGYPVVVKPARSVADVAQGRTKSAVLHADGMPALAAILDSLPMAVYPLLIQERVVGPGIGIFVLMRGGQAAAAFAHRRLREKPPSGGVSVLRESVPLHPELLERSCALLRNFEWEGVAMVEYKLDAATGTPYIMEINGRLWGSLQLAIDAGIDFPRLLLEDHAGEGTPPSYQIGIRSRWEWGEVDHLLARMRRSREELSLLPDAPGRGRAMLDFIRAFGPGNRNEILRREDPLPFLRESMDWIRGR